MQLSREAIIRMINGNGGGGNGSGNAFDPTILANYATQEWVDDNYLSLDFFNSLFRAKTSGGVDVLPNDGDTSTIASIKAMFGFWTDQYISALGNGSGGGGSTGALVDLTDVSISNPQNNQVLAYNAATTHWVNIDLPASYTLPTASASVLGGVKVGSTLAIDSGGVLNQKSIATAGTYRSVTIDIYGRVTSGSNPTTLAGYGITDAAFGTTSNDVRPITLGSTTQNVLIAHQSLTGLASETWVSNNYVSIAFFNRLFQAYNGTTQVTANDTTTTIDNIKAMVGFWTDQYISALGNGSGGGSSTGALVDLTDVAINTATLTDGQALVYDAATTHWVNATIAGSYTLPIATASVLGGIKVGTTLQINSTTGVLDIASGYATQSWVNTQLGSYLPLSGGTMTGSILAGTNKSYNIGSTTAKFYHGYIHRLYGLQSIENSLDGTYMLTLPSKNGTIAVYNTDNTYVLQGGGGQSKLKTVNGYSLFGTGDIQVGGGAGNYLPLSGGTLTGSLTIDVAGSSGASGGLYFRPLYNYNLSILPYNHEATYTDGLSINGYDGISFCTGSNSRQERMRITMAGLVGIGTTSPAYTLDVAGNMKINSSDDRYLRLIGSTTMWTLIAFKNDSNIFGLYDGDDSTNFYMSMDLEVNGGVYGNYLKSTGGNVLINAFNYGNGYGLSFRDGFLNTYNCSITVFNHNGGVYDGLSINGYNGVSICTGSNTRQERMRVDANGLVGIGTTSPSYKLHVSGDIYATGGVTALSDARHKTIIQDTQLSVEQIAGMPAVVYKWNDGREDDGLHVGSIAQDWQRILPQVVLTANDAEHTLSMQYGVAALVSAITLARKVVNHEQRISNLEKENAQFKAENAQLRAEITKLKAA